MNISRPLLKAHLITKVRKAMKRILAFIMVVCSLLCMSGCGENSARILYNNVDMKDYITLGKYKELEVDTKSEEFSEYYEAVRVEDADANLLYVKKIEGTVADGDIINIDYIGKKDGIAFEGGTAAGANLEIGSGTFIDGFESGLIGVNVGETVDLNLTFPADYGSAELAGQAVVFTVKVNYIQTDEPMPEGDCYRQLGFDSPKEYIDDLTKRAARNYLLDKAASNAKVKNYPSEEATILCDSYFTQQNEMCYNYYGVSLSKYLNMQGESIDSFKQNAMEKWVKPDMSKHMVFYAILDTEKLGLTEEEMEAQISKLVEQNKSDSVDREKIIEYYGEANIEIAVVTEKVGKFLYENAQIK